MELNRLKDFRFINIDVTNFGHSELSKGILGLIKGREGKTRL